MTGISPYTISPRHEQRCTLKTGLLTCPSPENTKHITALEHTSPPVASCDLTAVHGARLLRFAIPGGNALRRVPVASCRKMIPLMEVLGSPPREVPSVDSDVHQAGSSLELVWSMKVIRSLMANGGCDLELQGLWDCGNWNFPRMKFV